MIIRPSQKLCTKIKAGSLSTLPQDDNPFADWSANLFIADRTQYILLTNTKSLYSMVMYGKGISDDSTFIERVLSSLREFLADDGQQFTYRRFIAPASGTVAFAKTLNRSVTGSMNDLIFHAKAWLIEVDLSPYDVGFKLNDIPFSSLGYAKPKDAFKALNTAQAIQDDNES